jgi:hypothetical protein
MSGAHAAANAVFQAIRFDGPDLVDAATGEVIATFGEDRCWRGPDGSLTTGLDIPTPRVLATPAGPPRAERDEATNAAWRRGAVQVIRELAQTRETLTTDDVWAALGFPPIEGRQLGPVMLECKSARIIEPTDEYRPSTRSEVNHGRPLRVWRSLIAETPTLFDAGADDR